MAKEVLRDERLLTPEEIYDALRKSSKDDLMFNARLYLNEGLSVAKAQLDKPITRVCPGCKGSGKLPTGRRITDYPCLYCSGTGKITKTIREIVEEYF